MSCNACKTTDTKLLLCSRCKTTRYCSIACQRADWPSHKKDCTETFVLHIPDDNPSNTDPTKPLHKMIIVPQTPQATIVSEEEISLKLKQYFQSNWITNPQFTTALVFLYTHVCSTKGVFCILIDHRELDGLLCSRASSQTTQVPYLLSFFPEDTAKALGPYYSTALTTTDGSLHVWMMTTRDKTISILEHNTTHNKIIDYTGFGITTNLPPKLPPLCKNWVQRMTTISPLVFSMFKEGKCRLYPGEEGVRVIGGSTDLHPKP